MSFNRHTHTPDDPEYVLVPDLAWLIRNTPRLGKYVKGKNDCNHMAVKAMAKLQKRCVGMITIKTDDPKVNHTLNLVCMESKELMLYDCWLEELIEITNQELVKVWI